MFTDFIRASFLSFHCTDSTYPTMLVPKTEFKVSRSCSEISSFAAAPDLGDSVGVSGSPSFTGVAADSVGLRGKTSMGTGFDENTFGREDSMRLTLWVRTLASQNFPGNFAALLPGFSIGCYSLLL